jgi:hypothetical protein
MHTFNTPLFFVRIKSMSGLNVNLNNYVTGLSQNLFNANQTISGGPNKDLTSAEVNLQNDTATWLQTGSGKDAVIKDENSVKQGLQVGQASASTVDALTGFIGSMMNQVMMNSAAAGSAGWTTYQNGMASANPLGNQSPSAVAALVNAANAMGSAMPPSSSAYFNSMGLKDSSSGWSAPTGSTNPFTPDTNSWNQYVAAANSATPVLSDLATQGKLSSSQLNDLNSARASIGSSISSYDGTTTGFNSVLNSLDNFKALLQGDGISGAAFQSAYVPFTQAASSVTATTIT